jgi:AcrR family transcriptional regulator
VDVGDVNAGELDAGERRAGYRRSTGSNRGEARRQDLLDRVTDDLAVNGLVDFSLRRAARAAGTTHKVLLYHFDGVDDLLRQAIHRLRERRIGNLLTGARAPAPDPHGQPVRLSTRVLAIWPILITAEAGLRVLDQAIGLAMYDPARYQELGREAGRQYLPALLSICPPDWSQRRSLEVSHMILSVMRGLLVDWLTTGDTAGADAALAALGRALDREEASAG